EVGRDRLDRGEVGLDERADARLRRDLGRALGVLADSDDAVALAEEVEHLDRLLGEACDPPEPSRGSGVREHALDDVAGRGGNGARRRHRSHRPTHPAVGRTLSPVIRCSVRLASALALASLFLLAPACGGGSGSHTCTPAASYPAGIEHGPLVSRPSPTSEAIAFRSTASVVGGVEYGTTSSYGTTVSDASAATRHVLTRSPLAPSTTSHYRTLPGGDPAGVDHAFTTPPDQGATPVRFVVSGDGGTGCAQAFTMVSVAASQAPDFVLHTGDAAYEDGTASQVRTGFSIPWADVAATTPIFTTIGNHDFNSGGGQPLLDAQALPESSPGESRWYSFPWGPCHVICLDSNVDTA